MLFAPAAGEVPGSAVLVFDVELINVEEGLPEGYMFIWNEDVSSDLFSEMDKDANKLVEPSEVRPDHTAVEENSKTRWRDRSGFRPHQFHPPHLFFSSFFSSSQLVPPAPFS